MNPTTLLTVKMLASKNKRHWSMCCTWKEDDSSFWRTDLIGLDRRHQMNHCPLGTWPVARTFPRLAWTQTPVMQRNSEHNCTQVVKLILTPLLKISGHPGSGDADNSLYSKISSQFLRTKVSASKKTHLSNSVSFHAFNFVKVTWSSGRLMRASLAKSSDSMRFTVRTMSKVWPKRSLQK